MAVWFRYMRVDPLAGADVRECISVSVSLSQLELSPCTTIAESLRRSRAWWWYGEIIAARFYYSVGVVPVSLTLITFHFWNTALLNHIFRSKQYRIMVDVRGYVCALFLWDGLLITCYLILANIVVFWLYVYTYLILGNLTTQRGWLSLKVLTQLERGIARPNTNS